MAVTDHHPPSRVGVLSTYLAQYLTVAALFAGFLTIRLNLVTIAIRDPYSVASAANYGLFAFCAVFGLWFLVPGIFDRSLARMRYGLSRLVCDIGFALAGLATLLVWALLLKLPHSLPRIYMPQQTIFALAMIWLPLYVHAFLFPGAAFARHDEATGGASARSATRWPVAQDNFLTLPLGMPNVAGPGVEKPGMGTKLLAIPGLLALLLAYFGWAHPLWLPSAELQTFLAARHTELLLGFALLGAVIGWQGSGRRGGGTMKRLVQKTCGGATFAALLAVAAPFVAAVGLPYAVSFATSTTPASVEVTVVERGHAARRRACDYTASVTITGSSGTPATICDIPADLWETLSPGDRLVVSGPGTRFGIRYDAVTRVP